MLAFTLGLLLAFGQSSAIGPVNAESLRRGLRGGFRPALAVQLGSCLGDGVWALAALAGLGALFTLPLMAVGGTLLGAALLLWLAASGWRETVVLVSEPGGVMRHGARLPAFWAGVVLSVVNPGSAAFWLGVGATLLASRLPVTGPTTLGQFALGYYLALLIWSFSFAALSWQAGLRLSTRVQLVIQRGVALVLAGLAALSLTALARRALAD